jgi:hypothetical protein
MHFVLPLKKIDRCAFWVNNLTVFYTSQTNKQTLH